MMRNSYTMTKNAVLRFKMWLVKNNMSASDFARKCGVSRQYISSVICGRNYITKKCREIFQKGGYDLV